MQVRASLGVIATPFVYLAVIITIMEIVGGPVSILSDTAVMSASQGNGDYGHCRFWASVAHNISGMLSSVAVSKFGDSAVFIGYASSSLVAFSAAWHLDFSKVRYVRICTVHCLINENGCLSTTRMLTKKN
jgi:hypothetical protein